MKYNLTHPQKRAHLRGWGFTAALGGSKQDIMLSEWLRQLC